MINREFYAFCRDQRKVESDQQRCEVLQDVYGYMRECGVSKKGVLWYIEQRVYQEQGNESKVTAYQWLREQFVGPGSNVTHEDFRTMGLFSS